MVGRQVFSLIKRVRFSHRSHNISLMTRSSFLLTLPIISFLNRNKIFDYEYECRLKNQLYDKAPCVWYTNKLGKTSLVLGEGPEVEAWFDQWERVWQFETLYADREWIECEGVYKINWVPKNITESKFIKDCKDYGFTRYKDI